MFRGHDYQLVLIGEKVDLCWRQTPLFYRVKVRIKISEMEKKQTILRHGMDKMNPLKQ
jgi:hypothetical protein